MKSFSPAQPRVAPRPDVAAFEQLARALVGITLKSLSALDGVVSVSQFRLLLTLDGLGKVPSSVLAEALGMSASSVTRLVDRLQAAGLVERGSVEHSRSIVTVEVTPRGCALVTAVLDRRHALLEDVLDRMEPQERERASHLAVSFVDLAGDALVLGVNGPVPL